MAINIKIPTSIGYIRKRVGLRFSALNITAITMASIKIVTILRSLVLILRDFLRSIKLLISRLLCVLDSFEASRTFN